MVDGPQVIDAIGILPGHVIAYRHRFPNDTDFVERYANSVDAVMMYSVIQCLSKEQLQIDVSLAAVGLLRPSGRLLIGDIPNASKKGRFLASEFGKRFDREWRSSLPSQTPYWSESRANEALAFPNPQDDVSVVSLTLELRSAGFESYLLPQPEGLALNWSREDLLVVRW